MPALVHSRFALFHGEMAALAHLSWFVVPLVLLMGAMALRQFLARDRSLWGRYGHGLLVTFLWLMMLGAWYYTRQHPAWVLGRPWAPTLLAAALLALTVQSVVGLWLRHGTPTRSHTPRLIALHLVMAVGTSVLVWVSLWPYR